MVPFWTLPPCLIFDRLSDTYAEFVLYQKLHHFINSSCCFVSKGCCSILILFYIYNLVQSAYDNVVIVANNIINKAEKLRPQYFTLFCLNNFFS